MNILFHLVRLFFLFLLCVMVLWWLALMLHYHERTKEKIFWVDSDCFADGLHVLRQHFPKALVSAATLA